MSAGHAPTARSLVIAALVTLAAGGAAAQSKRHPRPPVDAEAEAEEKSDFWEEVVRPGARRYEQLLVSATDILRMRTGFERSRELLVEATAVRADLPEAWGYLGVATEKLRDWKTCAAAYGKAYQLDATWRPSRLASKNDTSTQNRNAAGRPLELGWATCLSRSGDIDRATDALEVLVARGEATAESWLRLGEVYMAAGRLGEAVTALDQARSERAGNMLARWLLAVAYDRARRPGDAEAAAADAGDVNNVTRDSSIPFVPASDYWYVRAFGSRQRPEHALVLFRTYLGKAGADSPWRARAQEHVDALDALDLATRVDLEGAGERAPVEKAVRAAMPGLRACLAAVPEVLIELRITQIGPAKALPPPRPLVIRRGAPPRPPPSRIPPQILARRPPEAQSPGVRATATIFEPGVDDAARNAAIDCVEKVGMALSLPRPPANTYATVRIPVVAER